MFNQVILQEQIRRWGLEATEKFCKMEAYKYALLAQYKRGEEDTTPSENLYERDWWELAAADLSLTINKNIKKS